ncbi:hypothetical protein FSY75_23530 [Streptomyces sp. TR1341]|uniref:DUF2231 domain-containing protein n=1 Tax=Streptomyces murinus TaxID=33900 RepID=A0A7W3NUA2_STRMR|nr:MULTISPECIES: DUF2231 domain-containing protein [Streptomyces]MBA9056843.1 hypothetical protein [Streptomyces murinus]NDK27380.1 hypothetical protein [Streptomyces sp. TR1341]UWW91252.1 hypothetical protein GO605_10555 [Streptomyces murinus]WSI88487.1 hypothetical protein OG516_30000 [Streptomyces murinus]
MTLINGLPAHVLLVHVVVVLVPLTALALVAAAIWPRAARRLGVLLPALGLVSLVSVPLTTSAGEWLERHVDSDPLVRRHTELGDGLLPWALGLFVLAVVVWWAGRGSRREGGGGSRWSALPVRIALGLLSVVIAVGAVVDVYRIGDSGAKAAWHDGFSKSAHDQHGADGS